MLGDEDVFRAASGNTDVCAARIEVGRAREPSGTVNVAQIVDADPFYPIVVGAAHLFGPREVARQIQFEQERIDWLSARVGVGRRGEIEDTRAGIEIDRLGELAGHVDVAPHRLNRITGIEARSADTFCPNVVAVSGQLPDEGVGISTGPGHRGEVCRARPRIEIDRVAEIARHKHSSRVVDVDRSGDVARCPADGTRP